mgnify:CR=1 FL=1
MPDSESDEDELRVGKGRPALGPDPVLVAGASGDALPTVTLLEPPSDGGLGTSSARETSQSNSESSRGDGDGDLGVWFGHHESMCGDGVPL